MNAYNAVEPWKNFRKIVAMQQCAKPTILYNNGKLSFVSETEGAICQSKITDSDISSYSEKEVQLCVTYNINVCATKTCFEESDVAMATLCWIDANPKTEGITDAVANVRARAVLIQNNENVLSISGANEGETINVYNTSDKIVGSALASPNTTIIPTSLNSGEIGILKIGNKAIRIMIK